MTTPEHENTAQTMRDVMRDLAKHDVVQSPTGDRFSEAHIVAIPQGRTIQDISHMHRAAAEYLKPTRRKGTAQLCDLQSLIDWANRFKGETSALFADPDLTAPQLSCIADYHASGPAEPSNPAGDPTARHCHHKATYHFPLSEEWKAWIEVSGKPMEKDELGDFIEAQAKDILDPTPAIIEGRASDKNENWENRMIDTARQIEGRYGQLTKLLAMSKSFQVHETSNLSVTTNRDTGEAEIQFVNEHKAPDGKPLNIPNLLMIAIPVFMGGAPYRMSVRFRYRKSGGSVKFILSIYNPEKVFEAAFSEAINEAKNSTELPLFMGTPEA